MCVCMYCPPPPPGSVLTGTQQQLPVGPWPHDRSSHQLSPFNSVVVAGIMSNLLHTCKVCYCLVNRKIIILVAPIGGGGRGPDAIVWLHFERANEPQSLLVAANVLGEVASK